MEQFLPLVAVVVLVAIAWKVLTGIVKTVALGALLVAAAVYVFGTEFGGFA